MISCFDSDRNLKNAPRLILASSSPRRKDILSLLGYPFEVRASDCDETLSGRESPEEAVKILSARKAFAVSRESGEAVLGADTVVFLNGRILGKPKNREDAFNTLSFLSGKVHHVYTGVTLITDDKTLVLSDMASVEFKELSEKDINSYIDTGECFGKAGSYAVQGIGERLVAKTEGDFYTIVGLPSILTDKILTDAGILKIKP